MSTIRASVVKSLFARSFNCCAYPGCSSPLVELNGVVTGEICHIKAESLGGPRYDPSQTNAERHSEGNLILLCSRHHTLIDARPEEFTVEFLLEIKQKHQASGTPRIPIGIDKIVEVLLQNYEIRVYVHTNSGIIAIASPNASIQQTINLKTSPTKKQVKITPPFGSIGSSQPMSLYIGYLIDRYHQFKKGDKETEGSYRYSAIHQAITREFKGKWQLLPECRFFDLSSYLQRRIDNTILGRINKSRGINNYSTYGEHHSLVSKNSTN